MIHVTTRGGPFAGASARTLERRAAKMLEELGVGGVELSIALVGDEEIRDLNRGYRKKDKPTDVLSFPLQEIDRHGPMSGVVGLIGDVILSVDTARLQARRRRRPLLDELTMLLAHGILHLLGYDHRTDAEESEMTARTKDLERAANARTRISP